MKRLFFTLLFGLSIITSYSQSQYLVANASLNYLYAGLDNKLDVLVQKYSFKDIQLTIDNGTIRKDSANYQFVICPSKTGAVYVTVQVIHHKHIKTIGQWFFTARNPPSPYFKIGPWGDGGKAKTFVLGAQQYARVEFNSLPIEAHALLDSFKVIVIRGKDTIYTKAEYGNKVSDRTRNEFYFLKEDDVIVFSDIWWKLRGGTTESKLNDATMTITKQAD